MGGCGRKGRRAGPGSTQRLGLGWQVWGLAGLSSLLYRGRRCNGGGLAGPLFASVGQTRLDRAQTAASRWPAVPCAACAVFQANGGSWSCWSQRACRREGEQRPMSGLERPVRGSPLPMSDGRGGPVGWQIGRAVCRHRRAARLDAGKPAENPDGGTTATGHDGCAAPKETVTMGWAVTFWSTDGGGPRT